MTMLAECWYARLATLWPKIPRGWALMAYKRNGKPVCRYFYPEAPHAHD